MERGCQIQNKIQKCGTNSFVDVRYEMKSDIRSDAKLYGLNSYMLPFISRRTTGGETDLVEKSQEFKFSYVRFRRTDMGLKFQGKIQAICTTMGSLQCKNSH